jgi:flagellin-like protein
MDMDFGVFSMMFNRKNEEAVSPVIGVILMVAITVILAAVIAAFVFGMAGNIQKTKVVAATESRTNSSYVTVTYQGGQDAGTMGGIAFTVDGANVTITTGGAAAVGTSPATNELIAAGGGTILPVGANAVIPASNPGKNHLVGVGLFTDGTTQVIVDTTL